MKIIFLDIDGVLCLERSHLAFAKDPQSLCLEWCPTASTLIRLLCQKTGAKIVISSTWRFHREHLFPALDKHGLSKHLFGDREDDSTDWKTPAIWNKSRGTEIAWWVGKHKPENYLIIDDVLDFEKNQNFLTTDSKHGFGADEYKEALEHFGNK